MLRPCLAEDGADAADDTGNVVVANDDEGSVQGCFDVNAIEGHEAGRGAVKHGGGAGGVALRRMQGEFEDGAGAAGDDVRFLSSWMRMPRSAVRWRRR